MKPEDRLNTVLSCRFCPMCHHVDTATTILRSETCSPRGRGLLLFAIEKKKLGWDASVADVMYKFTADGLSHRVCAGHLPHDDMVIDARERLVAEGVAPASVAAVRENIATKGNPWGEKEPDVRKLTGAGKGKTLVYVGSAARVRRPDSARALGKLLNKAGVSFSVLDEEGDPGLLLYQLGESDAASAAASRLATAIKKSGAKTVVTADADAYRALKAGFGDVKAASVEVRHASEVLGDLKFKAPRKKVGYNDPCALARFAPCIDPPRALLKKILGADAVELPWNRDQAACSGECGGVPFTNPALASGAAKRRVGQARDAGVELLVAGGAASADSLQGHGLAVVDLIELAASGLKS